MRLLFALLLLAAAPAEAFLFGRSSDKNAADSLGGMRSAFNGGDCVTVLALSENFLKEKPPAAMREEAYGYMGRCYEAAGSTDKAISFYKVALGLYPENSLFSSSLAQIYNQAGFPENAAPLFLQVLSLSPDDLPANLGLARAYAALGFFSRAAEFYAKGAALQNYADLPALEEYARCLLRKRDWGGAAFISAKGRAAAPRSALWPLLEARAWAGRGDYYKAVEALDAALRYESNRRLRLERALYLLLGGLPRRAAEAADAELALAAGDPLASAVKGMALYSLGEKTAAAPYFAAARSGGPFVSKIAGAFLNGSAPGPEDACKK
ncbi:MAG TPA: hypothetical protein DEQ38_12085 [Elusimicrobia bacterium]|nr:MAG: hypothetical protein A2089_05515 [Elusimicrobia bacterium GWD2_63_28]HCC48837.1 hypothetical protein [Elusimicrobiota bacterium]